MTDTPMQGERGEDSQGQHSHAETAGPKGDKGEKGETGKVPTELQDEVHALIESVGALAGLMKKFPDREEVKREGRKRTVKALLFGVVLILIAQLLTLGTVSYCFLTPQPGQSHRPYCSNIPGYDRAIEDGNARLARFQLLLTQIEENQTEIDENRTNIVKLEKEIQILNMQIEKLETQLKVARQTQTSTSP